MRSTSVVILAAALAAPSVVQAQHQQAPVHSPYAGMVLRAAHLKYHLAMIEVLTPDQRRRYGELRGYVGGGHRGYSHQ